MGAHRTGGQHRRGLKAAGTTQHIACAHRRPRVWWRTFRSGELLKSDFDFVKINQRHHKGQQFYESCPQKFSGHHLLLSSSCLLLYKGLETQDPHGQFWVHPSLEEDDAVDETEHLDTEGADTKELTQPVFDLAGDHGNPASSANGRAHTCRKWSEIAS